MVILTKKQLEKRLGERLKPFMNELRNKIGTVEEIIETLSSKVALIDGLISNDRTLYKELEQLRTEIKDEIKSVVESTLESMGNPQERIVKSMINQNEEDEKEIIDEWLFGVKKK